MNAGPGGTLPDRELPCGHLAEDVLAQVADGRGADRDAHQRSCPHCQAALAEYDRLWTPVRELAAEQVDSPESLVESALRRIRGAVEHSDYAVLGTPDGLTRISARVVVVLTREVAQAVPGVRVALSRHLTGGAAGAGPEAEAEVTAGVAGRSAAVEITLAADYGLDLRRLGEQVRAEVAARLRALTDLEPVEVTVIIDDVFS